MRTRRGRTVMDTDAAVALTGVSLIGRLSRPGGKRAPERRGYYGRIPLKKAAVATQRYR